MTMTDERLQTPTVSVVICAYTMERWDDLREAVASVRRQDLRPAEILVVIDHNDTLLRLAQSELRDATVIENEERGGLSGARNTGIKASRGSLIAFLDDDASAEPDWLSKLVQACADPQALGCGGIIEPAWRTGKPAWFPEEFNWVVGCSYLGLPRERGIVRNMIGSSMCFRREVFESIGGFRSDVGRVGKLPVGCEETELCLRALHHWPGRVFLYEPASRIHHTVTADRAQWRYFRSRCLFEGRSKAQVARLAGARDGLSSERLYTLRTLPAGVVRNTLQAITGRDLNGLARAGAIVSGLVITALGYTSGVINHTLAQWVNALRWHAPTAALSTSQATSPLLAPLFPERE